MDDGAPAAGPAEHHGGDHLEFETDAGVARTASEARAGSSAVESARMACMGDTLATTRRGALGAALDAAAIRALAARGE